MRVALILERYDPRLGGQERSTREMAEALAAQGVAVAIVCAASRPPAGLPESPRDGVRVTPLPAQGMTKAARTRAFLDAAERHCAEARFDVVHAITPCRFADVYQPRGGTYAETISRSVERVGSALRRRWRQFTRRLNTKQQALARIEREMLSSARPPLVACGSAYVRQMVLSAFPTFPADRARVVFNAVRVDGLSPEALAPRRAEARARLGLTADESVVLFVAHNFALKGLGELIEAMAFERRGDWRLVVAGRGDYAPFARQARRLGVSDRVKHVGALDDPAALFAAGDVLAHPTWYDPCSRVVIEAAAAGLPVVTTRFNGAAEILSAETGVVVDSPRDAKALAAAIAECQSMPFREAARARAQDIRTVVSITRHARELIALYAEVARG